ncbi:MAG: GNAT family N-acetyltransferase [Candidatus Nanohalobium sp.]
MDRAEINSVVNTNYRFLKSLYIKDTRETEFGFYAWSSVDYGDTDVFWNHAVVSRTVDNLEEKVGDVKKFYQKKEKNPAFYLPVSGPLKDVLTELKKKGFEEVFTDVWMFHTGEELPEGNENIELEEVSSKDDMEEFVNLFYRSHAAGLEDPYAGLSREYGEQLKDKFSKDFDGFRIQHFLVKHGDESVGHITSVENGEKAAIYNLGTIPDYRGKGVATATLRKTVEKLKEKDLDQIFLQTEKGSKNEDFFNSRGFETKFEVECLTK